MSIHSPAPIEPDFSLDDLRETDAFLRRVAARLCRDPAEAQDLVQDTFERALRRIHERPRNPRAWLAAILHNLFIDRCRARSRVPHMEAWDDDLINAADGDLHPEPTWANVTIDDVHAALEQLEPSFRDVYVLHTFEHRSYQEIAARFSIRSVTVGTRLTRARRMLRDILASRLAIPLAPA